jgi:FMN reductase
MSIGTTFRVVGVSGGLAAHSRTGALVEFVVKQAITDLPQMADLIDIADLVPELALTLTRGDATPKLEAALEKIETADLLVIGTPIAHGSYTGLLKHLLDLVAGARPGDRAAIIVATDSGDCNSLVLEHALRPLLSLLGYQTVPSAVYARDDDFVDLWVADEAVIDRARRAVREAFSVLGLDPPLNTFVSSRNSVRASLWT